MRIGNVGVQPENTGLPLQGGVEGGRGNSRERFSEHAKLSLFLSLSQSCLNINRIVWLIYQTLGRRYRIYGMDVPRVENSFSRDIKRLLYDHKWDSLVREPLCVCMRVWLCSRECPETTGIIMHCERAKEPEHKSSGINFVAMNTQISRARAIVWNKHGNFYFSSKHRALLKLMERNVISELYYIDVELHPFFRFSKSMIP